MEELCGLTGLGWEDRQEKAEEILRSNSRKQDLCNELQGLSFRELEQYLQNVATERQKKEEGVERKLTTNDKEPLRRNPIRPAAKPKPPPRTLAEILRQVYAPRVDSHEGLSSEERQRIGLSNPNRFSDLLSDPTDADN